MRMPKDLDKIITLYLYDELNDEEKHEFEALMQQEESVRNRMDEYRSLHDMLGKKSMAEPTGLLLQKSRLALRRRLQTERRLAWQESWFQRWVSGFRFPALRQLAGAVVMLVLGVFLGYVIPENQKKPIDSFEIAESGDVDSAISNVDLVAYEPQSGIVTVHYKSMQDVVLRGSIYDDSIRRVLAHTIRSEAHPGHRLLAVRAVGHDSFSDIDLQQALIYAMEHDPVDGVRLRAAKALKQLPANQNVQRAFTKVLLKDTNSAMRIVAVEALSASRQEDVFSAFQSAARADENEFVRLQTSRVLERREKVNSENSNGEIK